MKKEDVKEITLTQEPVFDGKVLHVRKDTVKTPNGIVTGREVIEHPGGVSIALETPEGKFYMVQQYRYAQDEVMIEFPAGKKEKGEDPLTCVKREVVEETGYEAIDIISLGQMIPTPAYDTEVIDLYYGRQGEYQGQSLDEDENITLLQMTLDEIIDKIVSGEIRDGKTMAMALLVKEYREKENEEKTSCD